MQDDDKKMVQFLTKIYANKKLKEDFKKYPKKILKKEGIKFTDKQDLRIVEDSKDDYYVIIPRAELTERFKMERLSANPNVAEVTRYLTTQIKEGNKKAEEHPKEFLKSKGIELSEEAKIHICRNTEKIRFVRIPRVVKDKGELSDYELQMVAGGKGGIIGDIGNVFGDVVHGISGIFGGGGGGGSSAPAAAKPAAPEFNPSDIVNTTGIGGGSGMSPEIHSFGGGDGLEIIIL